MTRSVVGSVAAACVTLALLAASGCSGNDGLLEVYPTEGRLLLDDEPLGHVMVRLVPGELNMDGSTHSVSGYVDESGAITFSTYDAGDGAPAGDYTVTVNVNPMLQPTGMFPQVYTSEKTSPLKVTITPEKGVNELTIELNSKAGRKKVGGNSPMMMPGGGGVFPGFEPPTESQ